MDRVELFPGWEVMRATFDCGTRHGIAIQALVNGKRRRRAIHYVPPLSASAMSALKEWVHEDA